MRKKRKEAEATEEYQATFLHIPTLRDYPLFHIFRKTVTNREDNHKLRTFVEETAMHHAVASSVTKMFQSESRGFCNWCL